MEIKYDSSHYSKMIIVKDTNVNIEFDVETREYGNNDRGQFACLKRDVSDEGLDMLSLCLDNMVYDRIAEYDSRSLIKSLFEKLPEDVREDLLNELVDECR